MNTYDPFLKIRIWLIGTEIVSIASVALVLLWTEQNPAYWFISLLLALFAYVCATDERPGMRNTSQCVVAVIFDLVVLCVLGLAYSLWTVVAFMGVHVGSIAMYPLVQDDILNRLRHNCDCVRRSNHLLRRELYFGLLFLFYLPIGIGKIEKGFIIIIAIFAVVCLCKIVYWWSWQLTMDTEAWYVKRLGKQFIYRFDEITKVISLSLIGELVCVNGHIPFLLYSNSVDNSYSFSCKLFKIKRKLNLQNRLDEKV